MFKKALFWKKINNLIECCLCPRHCKIPQNEKGVCRTRKNINGELIALTYGYPISINIDPIEKKPFYHFYPGNLALSIGTVGCNFLCLHCQNWEISHANPEDFHLEFVSPEEIINLCKKYNINIISYTYNEPTVFYEYCLDIMKLAKKKGILNTLVSNGFIEEEPLLEMIKYLDAINVDIKTMNPKTLLYLAGTDKLDRILENVKILYEKKVHIELTYLIIPEINDKDSEINKFVKWVTNEVSSDIPIHFNKFFPNYKLLDKPETSLETLIRARNIAIENGVKFVYIGNIYYPEAFNTYCPNCGKTIIERDYMKTIKVFIENNKCKYCGEKIYGVF